MAGLGAWRWLGVLFFFKELLEVHGVLVMIWYIEFPKGLVKS